ncbi:competence protein CoiA family protein [Streptomyces antimycoticus]|uniref:competence protein CoiA family protein n=1 Tax=Streptomyces antimycoticus TaxID=68175 RepID=UPI003433AA48
MSVVDTRLVQTAVIGTRDSDQPVILPEEPYNLDQFRRHFQQKRFWCGTLLGGCGEELMTKRYESKVCHFAHFPDRTGLAPTCHRVANGADSPDHLFIKRDLTDWLKTQGVRVQAELRNLGTGPGDAVDFWLPSTHQRLRFQLCLQDYRTWYRAKQEPTRSTPPVDDQSSQ